MSKRILLIKTSSMGDLIHTLPALTDAGAAFPDISFDWMVETSFKEIPHWHPLVRNVIPVSLRRWRKEIVKRETWSQVGGLARQLRAQGQYDLILDAQGLVKSAVLGFLGQGVRAGLDFHSARESLASLMYQQKHTVNFYQHAVVRMRSLFSKALGYPLPLSAPDFGLNALRKETQQEKYIVLLHGTTWASKQWPEQYWIELARLAAAEGYRLRLSGGNPVEVERAQRIAQGNPYVDVTPYLTISQMAQVLAKAHAAVAVDTGFGHLASALGVPTVSMYSSTNPEYTGALGAASVHLTPQFSCSPCLNRACTYRQSTAVEPACFEQITPALVWDTLKKVASV